MRLNDNLANAIEQTVYSLPSFGDTFVENTDEGVKISITDADKIVHEALSGYLVFEGLTTEVKDNYILISKKSKDGLTNEKLNTLYRQLLATKDTKLIEQFDKMILPFLGKSNTRIEVSNNHIEMVAESLTQILDQHNIQHNNFSVSKVMVESSIMDVMPNVRIGDTIEVMTSKDLDDNFGKYTKKIPNRTDLDMWLNNGGIIEIEVTDTLADTINGILVDVRFKDGISKLRDYKSVQNAISKFFTDEDMKSHLGNKRLFEEFGFTKPSDEYIAQNPDADADILVATVESGSLVYSPANKLVRVYPGDGEPFVVEPVVNENDANRVLIAINDSDNDSSILMDILDDMGMTMTIDSDVNEGKLNKDEFLAIIAHHNVSGKEITSNQITDKMVSDFNNKLADFLKKYPDFEIFADDYSGKEDDEFVEMLISVLKPGNLSII